MECLKSYLMGYTSRSMKNSGAESDLNFEGLVQEASVEKEYQYVT